MSVHNSAKPGDIAPRILLPGDPLRAKHIAETYLENPVCFNRLRGMLGFTGTYKGKEVSVMGTGMGVPSISIYVNELFDEYKVKRAIRVGTCGTMHPDFKLRDLLLVNGASTNSAVNRQRFGGEIAYAPVPDFSLLHDAYRQVTEKEIPFKVGPVMTDDLFYVSEKEMARRVELLSSYGIFGCDMETSELYTLGAQYGAQTLSILTCSDSMLDGSQVPPAERQLSFNRMCEVALEIV